MYSPKVILVILDGWGYSEEKKGNAIALANTPTYNNLLKNYPHTLINAFGQSVGLPFGATGSSEVGHKSIGCGEKVTQEFSLINEKINNKSFFTNKKLLGLINNLKKNGHPLHLIGLISDGGVHSHIEHLFTILEFLKDQNFRSNIYIHMISDGRDCDTHSAKKYINDLKNKIKEYHLNAEIASISGRYFAMDRDNHWDRTKKALAVMTEDCPSKAASPEEVIDQSYKADITDEFINPVQIQTTLKDNIGSGLFSRFFKKTLASNKGYVQSGDGVLFFNIRADRMRQLVELFIDANKDADTKPIKGAEVLTLTTYNEAFHIPVLYPTQKIKNPLAKILSDHGYSQGHFAETEKYAHVTYFFNGENPDPFPHEEWFLIPSPNVSTFDKKPEMSADKITEKVISVLKAKKLDFVLINYANADMVGHTGKLKETIQAVESIDKQLKKLTENFPDSNIIITADHGNAERKIDPYYQEPQTNHTDNPVPFILVGKNFKLPESKVTLKQSGILADITATVLHLYGLDKIKIDGVSLLED